MSEYIIEFSKTGTICYTSHLDLMRIFKRVFKRTGVALAYSQGFNPHPKMGFAQPLSLGYWGMQEYFECETADDWDPEELLQRLAPGMPEGIELKQCLPAEHLTKTLASHTVAAEYMIAIPMMPEEDVEAAGAPGASEMAGPAGAPGTTEAAGTLAATGADGSTEVTKTLKTAETTGAAGADGSTGAEETAKPEAGIAAVEPDPDVDLTDPRFLWHSFMGLPQIQVWKRQKKKKEPKLVDIRPMIREITFSPESASGVLYVQAVLDCGSDSNLSPELIISSVCRRFRIPTDRSEVSVMRRHIVFDQPLDVLLKRN